MPKETGHERYLREKALKDEQFALTNPLDYAPQDIRLAKSFGQSALDAFARVTKKNVPETIRLLGANVMAGTEILRRYRTEYIPELEKPADYWPAFKNVPVDTPVAQNALAGQVKELEKALTSAKLRFG